MPNLTIIDHIFVCQSHKTYCKWKHTWTSLIFELRRLPCCTTFAYHGVNTTIKQSFVNWLLFNSKPNLHFSHCQVSKNQSVNQLVNQFI